MGKFMTAEVIKNVLSTKWNDTAAALKHHVVKAAKGTEAAAEYLDAYTDAPLGVIADSGTSLNWISVNEAGVVRCVNSTAGTIAINDPVVIDYSYNVGTAGRVRSGVVGQTSIMGGTSRINMGLRVKTKIKNIVLGTASAGCHLDLCGTLLTFPPDTGIVNVTGATYDLDIPVIGRALEAATAPGQIFKVLIQKDNFEGNT